MTSKDLIELKELASKDFDSAIRKAAIIPPLRVFFGTWSDHCGAPRDVFIGQLVAALVSEND